MFSCVSRSAVIVICPVVAFIAAACASFDEPPSSAADGGATPDGAAGTGSFCASKSNYDVCSDFDDDRAPPTAGWDNVSGPNGAPPKIDSSDARSAPSSLRFDFTGEAASGLGLTKVLGSGTVYHIETAVRFGGKVQKDFVDVARIVIGSAGGELDIDLDMLPTGLHYEICPPDPTKCVNGNEDFDLLEWKTIAFDFDVTAPKATLTIGGVVILNDTTASAAAPTTVEKMTVTIGPRNVAAGNTVVVRYDDILVSHH